MSATVIFNIIICHLLITWQLHVYAWLLKFNMQLSLYQLVKTCLQNWLNPLICYLFAVAVVQMLITYW